MDSNIGKREEFHLWYKFKFVRVSLHKIILKARNNNENNQQMS